MVILILNVEKWGNYLSLSEGKLALIFFKVLESVNQNLEEDRRSLMSQVSLLLTQYHDLLTQTLEDKQHFHQEEKNFT